MEALCSFPKLVKANATILPVRQLPALVLARTEKHEPVFRGLPQDSWTMATAHYYGQADRSDVAQRC
ncbi:MAG: hypothetical protein PHD43_16875 [Methylococcales bacterium]|nr:hypothetical protein [Methylococcales bacterium]